MFKYLGFTEEEAKAQFGFLMDAFHLERHLTEVWLWFDRLVAILRSRNHKGLLLLQNNSEGML
jgi:aspartyl-tRNA synthetase